MNTYSRVLLVDYEIHSSELLGVLFWLSKTHDMCMELSLGYLGKYLLEGICFPLQHTHCLHVWPEYTAHSPLSYNALVSLFRVSFSFWSLSGWAENWVKCIPLYHKEGMICLKAYSVLYQHWNITILGINRVTKCIYKTDVNWYTKVMKLKSYISVLQFSWLVPLPYDRS